MAKEYYISRYSGEPFDKAIDFMIEHEDAVKDGIKQVKEAANSIKDNLVVNNVVDDLNSIL